MSKKMYNEYEFLQKKSANAEVNVGPLLDMVFILLIFFVITTNFNKETGIDVNKPKAQSSVTLGQKIILIGISREGTIHIFGKQIATDALYGILKREAEKRPGVSVVIVGDKGSTLGSSVEVMDVCTKAGIDKVSVSTEQN